MGNFFIYILSASFCLALLYLPFYFLLRKDTFYAFNRFALLLIVLLSALLPLTDISWFQLPESAVQVTSISEFSQQIQEVSLPDIIIGNSNQTPHMGALLLCLVYFIGLFICATKKALEFIRYYNIRKKGCLWTERINGITIYYHANQVTPHSWMRSIVISDKDYQENGHEILLHEQAHIHHGHSWDILLITLAQLFLWFNPFIWMLGNDLRDIHEYQADLMVLQDNKINAKQYQLLIIKKAIGSSLNCTLTNNFNHSLLKKRINMMFKQKSNPWALAKYLYLLPVTAICLMACSQAEKKNNEVNNNEEKVVTNISESTQLYIVDGKEVSKEQLKAIASESIANMSVLKNEEAIKQYGEKGKDGVIIVTTKGNENKERANTQNETGVVFNVVEQMPEFADGGMPGLMKYLGANIKYPEEAKKNKIEGRVIIQFVVAKDGSIKDATILRSVSPELDAEALRVINAMPNWKPGMQKGKPVNVKFTIPVTFKLQ